MKKSIILVLFGILLSLCTGCVLKTGTDLLQAPKPNKDSQAITDELNRLKGNGTLVAPYEGSNRNTIQMVDLDGDGIEEVISFIRTSANANQFQTIILKKQPDETYTCVGSMEGTGLQIGSIQYPKWGDHRGILLTVQQVGEMHEHLIAADYRNGEIHRLLEIDLHNHMLVDLNADGNEDIFIIAGMENRRTASLYMYEQKNLRMVGETPLTASVRIVQKMVSGYIADQMPAVFVEETVEGGNGQQTDIFVYQEQEGLRNLALNTENNTGQSTYRVVLADAYDINQDGMLEIPRTVHMKGSLSNDLDPVYMLDWYLYSATNPPAYVQTTYRNVAQDWDFVISQEWYDAVHAVKGSTDGSEYTTFEVYREKKPNIPILTIFCLFGTEEERQEQMQQYDLLELDQTSSVTFAAYIPPEAIQSPLALTPQQVRERFSVISVDWNATHP